MFLMDAPHSKPPTAHMAGPTKPRLHIATVHTWILPPSSGMIVSFGTNCDTLSSASGWRPGPLQCADSTFYDVQLVCDSMIEKLVAAHATRKACPGTHVSTCDVEAHCKVQEPSHVRGGAMTTKDTRTHEKCAAMC